MYNINPVNISIFFFCYKQAYFFFIRIGHHLACAKRQLENNLGMFATLHRKLSQMNKKFAFVLRVTANVSVHRMHS